MKRWLAAPVPSPRRSTSSRLPLDRFAVHYNEERPHRSRVPTHPGQGLWVPTEGGVGQAGRRPRLSATRRHRQGRPDHVAHRRAKPAPRPGHPTNRHRRPRPRPRSRGARRRASTGRAHLESRRRPNEGLPGNGRDATEAQSHTSSATSCTFRVFPVSCDVTCGP